VGIVLFGRKLFEALVKFIGGLMVKGGVRVLKLLTYDMREVTAVVAEKYGLTMVSFDSDFNQTEKIPNPLEA